MSNRGLLGIVEDSSIIVKNYDTYVPLMTEKEVLQLSRAYLHIRDYAKAGDALQDWLRKNKSEKVSKLLSKLKPNVRLSRVKGKLYEINQDKLLGSLGETKYKLISTEHMKYDEHGNMTEYYERDKFDKYNYWRRDYIYGNGDNPVCYTEYDNEGNITNVYNAVLRSDGKIESEELEYKRSGSVRRSKYTYDLDGLLIAKYVYKGGKQIEGHSYVYDDLDRLIVHSYTDEYLDNIVYRYTYTRHSAKVIEEYEVSGKVKYRQEKYDDFMGNISSVEKFVDRSDCGWVTAGFKRVYKNTYVRK